MRAPLRASLTYARLLTALATVLLLPQAASAGKGGVGLSKISLPSGPGSIEGLGDSFEPHINTGASSHSVGLTIPPGVAGLQPSPSLSYSSGAGNSAFGLAWDCTMLSIQRQTEKGYPAYGPQDRFTLDGEELVPLDDGSYRCENESGFRRVTRSGTGWIVWEKNGTRQYLGSKPLADNPSRVVRPGGRETFDDTFKWCVDDTVDVHGNRMEHRYVRFPDSPGAIYCEEIRYSLFGPNYHAISFDYEPRPDSFNSFLSGFEVRTGRRCWQIRVLSRNALVRRYRLSYTLPADDPVERQNPSDTGLAFSQLRQFTQFDNGEAAVNYLPPLRFGYTRLDAAQVQRGSFLNPSGYSLAHPELSLTDINCDSLPDLFFTDPVSGRHSVWTNFGLGRWSGERLFAKQPTGTTLGNPGVQLADLDGDGRVDLIQKAGTGPGSHFVFHPNSVRPSGNDDARPSWGAERSFATPHPQFAFDDPTVRSLDLNGDKRIDYMRTAAFGFTYYYNRQGSAGALPYWEEDGLYLFGEPELGDLTYGDAIDFADSAHVKLVDMNGDRLLDIVRQSTSNPTSPALDITWWPNKGRGRWGTRESVAVPISIGLASLDDIHYEDVNGDGISDIVALAVDHVDYWINYGSSRFSPRYQVPRTPDYIRGQTNFRTADINGNGSTDLLFENWDSAAGTWRISWIDFIGSEKPNLLNVIDNGIGLQTEMSYRPSTDYYVAALFGSNPWTTRLPFPNWCVAKSEKHFGLDLDAIPGEDRYITEYSYHDGYYDPQEKEFRGFAFSRSVARGDDRFPGVEVNSPSGITRIAFHTGVPDQVDNDNDGLVDERDDSGGYEEEPLKGRVLWTEKSMLTPEFDGADNDGDGFIDEADEGPGSGQLAPDAVVFSRAYQTWQFKTIHSPAGGFSQPGASQPFASTNGQRVTFCFSAIQQNEQLDAVETLHQAEPFAAGANKMITRTECEMDFFGLPTVQRSFGIVSGGALAPYDDERFISTDHRFNLDRWLIGLKTQTLVTDENDRLVSKSQVLYDHLPHGQIGSRGLATSKRDYIGTSSTPLNQPAELPGDPRTGSDAALTSTFEYDAYGNIVVGRDGAYTAPGAGHERRTSYDAVFHTYAESETIVVGGGSPDLVATATYDSGSGVITSYTDFNRNTTTYLYDSFFRLTGNVRPGDSLALPTQTMSYKAGDTLRKLVYSYTSAGTLTRSLSPEPLVLSYVTTHNRENAGEQGTFDVVTITDGAAHSLGTIEEGAAPDQFVFRGVTRYTSTGAKRDQYLDFFGSGAVFREPPPDGPRGTSFYDADGRLMRTLNPPERSGAGSTRTSTRIALLPGTTITFDEEDDLAASPHAGTPSIQHVDGLGRVLEVHELNKESGILRDYTTRFRHDLCDNLISVTDAQNNVKWTRFDALKRIVSANDPDRGFQVCLYDNSSNLLQRTDAKGQITVMTYDGANRILTEDYLDAAGLTPDVAYHYDLPASVTAGDGATFTTANAAGTLSWVADLSGREFLSYDARGRLAWRARQLPSHPRGPLITYRTQSAYDSLDRATRHTYPDGDFAEYHFNSRSLLAEVTGGPAGTIISSVTYRPSGQAESVTLGNGVVTRREYDPRQRLSRLSTTSGSTALIDNAYDLDPPGNIRRIDDLRPLSGPRQNTQVFTYDDLYRLTSVVYPQLPGNAHIDYSFDRIGNLTSQSSPLPHSDRGVPVAHLGALSYGAQGRTGKLPGQPGPHAATSPGTGRTAAYDDNGNVTSMDGIATSWDFKNRLVSTEDSTMRADYLYDHADKRTAKIVRQKLSGGALGTPEVTHYVDGACEVRPDGGMIKYVLNGSTKVARITTMLNAAQRTQHTAIFPGANIVALAITTQNTGAQLARPFIRAAFRYEAGSQRYHQIGAGETVAAGTILRIEASAAVDLSLTGTWTAPASEPHPAGGQWVVNRTSRALDLDAFLPAGSAIWKHDAPDQSWRLRIPQGFLDEVPSQLLPGEIVFASAPAPFVLSAPEPALEIRYYHSDHLGSATVMTDAAGRLVSEVAYFPYGQPRNTFEPQSAPEYYGFAQKEKDRESGLSHFDARNLSTATARFMSVDPVFSGLVAGGESFKQAAADPQSLNTYSYARGNPVRFEDSGGMAPGDVFKSVEEAGLDATRHFNRRSVKENREYGGTIYYVDGFGYFYNAVPGKVASVMFPPDMQGAVTVGFWHTHGNHALQHGKKIIVTGDPKRDSWASNDWSDQDIRTARSIQPSQGYRADSFATKSFVGTPTGGIRIYDPKTHTERVVAEDPRVEALNNDLRAAVAAQNAFVEQMNERDALDRAMAKSDARWERYQQCVTNGEAKRSWFDKLMNQPNSIAADCAAEPMRRPSEEAATQSR